MEKPMRVLLTFPPSAPFYRVISAIREIGKTSLPVRPSVGLPDFDEGDEEQLAMFNQLQQYGVRLDDVLQVTTDAEVAEAEDEEEERRRADWEAVRAAATARATDAVVAGAHPVPEQDDQQVQQQAGEYSEAYGAAGTPNPVLEHQSERLEHSSTDVPGAGQQQADSEPASTSTDTDTDTTTQSE